MHYPSDPRTVAKHTNRNPDTGLPWPYGSRTGNPERCTAGCDESQSGNCTASVQSASGFDYEYSLSLLKRFKEQHPNVPTKSGIMVGLGETDEEVLQVMRDMRAHNVDMITIGQYLAPSNHHLPVRRYVHPDASKCMKKKPTKWASHMRLSVRWFVRYHADQQAHGVTA
jgi:lipoate synthase